MKKKVAWSLGQSGYSTKVYSSRFSKSNAKEHHGLGRLLTFATANVMVKEITSLPTLGPCECLLQTDQVYT